MNVEKARIRQKVRVPSGYEAEIVEISKDGWCRVDFGPNMAHYMPVRAGHLEPVSDPCEGCQKLASIDKCCEYWKAACEEARRNATYWREELTKLQKEALECKMLPSTGMANVVCSGKRPLSEVAKLREIVSHIPPCTQHGAWCPDHMIDWIKARKHEEEERMAERVLVPLHEVAKCYIRVAPEKPLMSQEARRVVEYLEASGPRTAQRMAGNLDLPTWRVLDAIIEAREAGRISLSGDEYSIVRD
jgi:hypothetical protein